MKNQFQCEICGEWADGKTFRIIEGIKMIVCKGCQNIGKKSPQRHSNQKKDYPSKRLNSQTYKRYNKNKVEPKRSKFTKRTPRIEELELVDNYRTILKNFRQKKNMTLSEFANLVKITEANYKSIESGKMDLLIKNALEIEKKFNISLTQIIQEDDFDNTFLPSKTSNYTLGDVFIKRKKSRKRK